MDALSPKAILFLLLALLGAGFAGYWWLAERRRRGIAARGGPGAGLRPTWRQIAVGVVTDFLDALGVGSFATTTSLYKLGKMVPDEDIPGTMNVGHTFPTFAEAFIFISVVEVDMTTLSLMVASSVVGAWAGAGVVARWPRRKVQIGMGILLNVSQHASSTHVITMTMPTQDA